jgi:HEAT repeats
MDLTERRAILKILESRTDDTNENKEYRREFASIARPIVKELTHLGYEVGSLDELRHVGRPWKSALPVLLKWLPMIQHPGVKQSIVRGLSVPWVGNRATGLLIQEFRKSPPGPGLAWTIGNALSIVSIECFEDQIVELSKNSGYGVARQMIVLGLSRLRTPEAEDAAISLLGDEGVKLHAIVALRKMNSQRAVPAIEKLLDDKRSVIRREARKAITKIVGSGGCRTRKGRVKGRKPTRQLP